jgi:hypothetical protein
MAHKIYLPPISVGATEIITLDLQDDLDTSETFTGNTPTIVETGSSDLTLDNKTVSTGSLTVLDRTVDPGKAIQWRMSGQLANTTYTITVTCATTSTPARTKKYEAIIPTI